MPGPELDIHPTQWRQLRDWLDGSHPRIAGDEGDFPGDDREATVIIGTDGERVTVHAETDRSLRLREWDDAVARAWP